MIATMSDQHRRFDRAGNARPGQHDRRNIAERLFPGPSAPMSQQDAEHLQELLRSRGERFGRGAHAGRPTADAGAPAPQRAADSAVADDFDGVREALESQNELLRAILSSSVDSQADARATAQNSRTFAWAGTAIAFLTLIATIILIVPIIAS
jgi:hypothetical protein